MKTYLVGGAVRDALMGLPVKDRDWVVVGATPQALLDQGYLPVGRDFPGFLHPTTKDEGALARTELVGVGERVLQQLHDRDDPRALVLDVLDRRAVLTNVTEQQRDSAATLGQLQRGVDGTPDGLHVVLDAQQKTAHRLAALGLAGVEKRRGGRLEAAVDDLVDELLGQRGVTGGQRERHHHHAVLEALQVALPVEGLQRVGGVVLERTQERREAELLGVGPVGQRLDEVA